MDSIFESENVKLRSITYNELENCNSSKTIPSTKIQREIWASIVLDNNASLSYNESLAIELNESIDSIALNNAFQYLLHRHDSLRCAFSLDGKSFYVKEFAPDNIRYLDYSFKDLQDIEILKKADVDFKYDLVNGPCYRATLVKISLNQYLFIFSVHQLICDESSLVVLIQELSECYEIIKRSKLPDRLEGKSFADFAKEEHIKDDCLDDKNYWLKEFERPLIVNPFPVEIERPTFRTFNSARYDVCASKELVQLIKKLEFEEGYNTNDILLSALNVFLFKLTKSQNIIVGMILKSHLQLDHKVLISNSVKLLPLKMDLLGDVSFSAFMESVKQKIRDAVDHQSYTYGELIKDLKKTERDPALIPLFNIVFNFDEQGPRRKFNLFGLHEKRFTLPKHYENFEIYIKAVSDGEELYFECQYNTNLFTSSIIENWFSNFLELIKQLVSNTSKNIKFFNLPYLKIPTSKVKEDIKPSKVLIRNSQIEDKIKNIWSCVLLNNSIDIQDNFFFIGGHSLLAAEVVTLLIKEFKINISIQDIFKNPTILELSHKIGLDLHESYIGLPELVANTFTTVSAGHNQLQLWYLEEKHPQTLLHNLPTSIRIQSKIDRLALEKALSFIIERHPVLRTAIIVENGIHVQKILDKNLPEFSFKLEQVKTTENEILDLIKTEIQIKFDKTQPPLIKAKLYELDTDDYVFFFMVHHAVWDEWSFNIFFEELNIVYSAYVKKSIPIFIKNPDITYADYSSWLHSLISQKALNNQIAYWEEKLKAPLPILELPLDYKRPLNLTHDGEKISFILSSEITHSLKEYAKMQDTSLFNIFLTAFKITLARYSGLKDIIVGLPVRGRDRPEVMQTIGHFVNNIALRTQINHNQSFEDNLRHVSNTCTEAFDNQLVPFQIILNKINYSKDATRTPIFQTFFSYQDVQNKPQLLNGNPYSHLNFDQTSVHTDLDLWIKTSDHKIEGAIHYRKDLFKEISIERFKESLFHILGLLNENLHKPLNIIKSIPLKHEDLIMLEWNDTWTNKLDFVPFHVIFAQNAYHNPDTVAIETQDEKVTFGELNRRAIRCANALIERGVGREDLVGISLTRTSDLMVALLGVLKTGAGYVPLDPGFPQERLDYMIVNSTPKILITEESLTDRFNDFKDKLILSSIISDLSFDRDLPKVKHELTDTVYVIYTSGSTGNPKGVQLTHGSVTNFLLSMKDTIVVGHTDRIIAVTTLSFDIAVLELFLPLITGGTIFLASTSEAMDGEALKSILENKNITIMQATPSTWRLLLATGWKGSKKIKILCGGEAFPKDLAETLIPICQEVWNMYGPTETTVWSTCKKLSLTDDFISIGRPIANTSLYILDENRFMKPIGVAGELFIGGYGLAHGYFGREDLTNERFMADPFILGGRMYATGDIARFTHNGEVECLGRNDGQVKVRGYRIELGEIEAEIHKIPNVNVAAVITSEYRPGDVRIFSYYSTLDGEALEERMLRENLSKKLPLYMIPSHFTHMQQIPQTLNGKIDKKSLPKVNFSNSDFYEFTPLINKVSDDEVKSKLRLIWIKILGVNEISDSDNFFNIGGNSLLAVELFSKIAAIFKVNMPLSSLFDALDFGVFSQKFIEKIHHNESVSLAPQLFKSLVVIKADGVKNPIFCFHGVGGNVLNYVALIPATNNERPLIALQSLGLDGVTIPLRTIEEMAKSYIREIRLIQPSGPYLLTGGSMGGMIAFEVALQLIKSGEKIEKIIMFDTFGPNLDLKSNRSNTTSSYLSRFKDSYNMRKKFFINKIISKIYRLLNKNIPLKILLTEIENKNYQAIWKYYPRERLNADLYLIRAPIESSGWYSDPLMGWKGMINGKINIFEMTGNHDSFVECPELVNILKKLI